MSLVLLDTRLMLDAMGLRHNTWLGPAEYLNAMSLSSFRTNFHRMVGPIAMDDMFKARLQRDRCGLSILTRASK